MMVSAAIANIIMLALLPGSAKLTASGDQNIRHLILCLLAFGLFLYALRRAGDEIISVLREQIAARGLAITMRSCEHNDALNAGLDANAIKARLDAISRGAVGLPKAALAEQAAMAATLAFVYIELTSPAALGLALGFLLLIIPIFRRHMRDYKAARKIVDFPTYAPEGAEFTLAAAILVNAEAQ